EHPSVVSSVREHVRAPYIAAQHRPKRGFPYSNHDAMLTTLGAGSDRIPRCGGGARRLAMMEPDDILIQCMAWGARIEVAGGWEIVSEEAFWHRRQRHPELVELD